MAPTTPSDTNAASEDLPIEDAVSMDSGLVCWLQVIGCFATWTNTFGLVNAYGEFQTYYESILPQTPSELAWIGSIQSFLLLFCGLFTGPLFDIGYFRLLLVVGNLLIVFGMMMTSICKAYWQIALAQGVVVGLGMGAIFVPSIAVLPQYFSKRLQFANGVATIGSGFGGVIYPIMLHRLTPSISFPWAVRVIGFMSLSLAVISVLTLRNKKAPGQKRRLVPPGLLHDIPFILYTGGLFLILVALYIPVVYITSYSLEKRITSAELAFYLVPILQAANIGGRLLAFFADWTGPVNLTIPALIIASVLVFCWIAVRNEAGIIVFALLYGVVFGIIQGLGPGCVASLTTDKSILGSRLGFSFGLVSFGLLIGTPVAGSILGQGNNFVGVQIFAGVVIFVSATFYISCRLNKVGLRVTKL